ncbi:hypothetical protein LQZ24_01720 [Fructobacillus sp. M1-13]|uniref:Uncharacterized protein n=1 Tax=Fructobacillus papyriferae TaxID=2713171 RepID=A0ABS5QPM4_9LACO|nr:hypothetical protein [Fructobacillus papyriferae]MBS9334757.1 hypothetical protein [Fructobacillus papyriferae]MCD2158747.1 hypothetical protein [Fructobacillus papyriferae]
MSDTFEVKNMIGRLISGSDFDVVDGLVQVIGNYYHYVLGNGDETVEKEASYVVKAVTGNQLFVEKVEEKE